MPVFETTDADHGRIATRRHRVSHDVAGLNGSRSAPAEPRFPGLRAIACVDAVTERSGQTTRARRFFQPSLPLSSLPLNETLLARAVRAHRGIENRLHRVLDVLPRENDSLDRFLILVNPRRPDAPAHRQRKAGNLRL